MGWRGYKGTIDVGMLFKKMFCQNCGTRLRIKKNSQIINKGDKEFSNRMPGKGNAIGMSSYYSVTYAYLCPICNSEISYDAQCVIAKEAQKSRKLCNTNDAPSVMKQVNKVFSKIRKKYPSIDVKAYFLYDDGQPYIPENKQSFDKVIVELRTDEKYWSEVCFVKKTFITNGTECYYYEPLHYWENVKDYKNLCKLLLE